jgi:CheY-like chemotaxis protein
MSQVLLVEDNDFIRKMYVMKLSKAPGIDIVEAADGEAGLEAYKAHQPDLILLDIMMPKMSGLEVLEQLQKLGSKTPVIILSNVLSSDTRQAADKYGVVDYIIKSDLTPSQVLEKIQANLK